MAFQNLQALPEPVLRYFKYCLKEGQRPVKFCALKQRGAFRCLPACAAQAMGMLSCNICPMEHCYWEPAVLP